MDRGVDPVKELELEMLYEVEKRKKMSKTTDGSMP